MTPSRFTVRITWPSGFSGVYTPEQLARMVDRVQAVLRVLSGEIVTVRPNGAREK